jgi:hypothetical protein
LYALDFNTVASEGQRGVERPFWGEVPGVAKVKAINFRRFTDLGGHSGMISTLANLAAQTELASTYNRTTGLMSNQEANPLLYCRIILYWGPHFERKRPCHARFRCCSTVSHGWAQRYLCLATAQQRVGW